MTILTFSWKGSHSFPSLGRSSRSSSSLLSWGPVPANSQPKRYSSGQYWLSLSCINRPSMTSKLVCCFRWRTHGKKQRSQRWWLLNRLRLPSKSNEIFYFNIIFSLFTLSPILVRFKIRGNLVSNKVFLRNKKTGKEKTRKTFSCVLIPNNCHYMKNFQIQIKCKKSKRWLTKLVGFSKPNKKKRMICCNQRFWTLL